MLRRTRTVSDIRDEIDRKMEEYYARKPRGVSYEEYFGANGNVYGSARPTSSLERLQAASTPGS